MSAPNSECSGKVVFYDFIKDSMYMFIVSYFKIGPVYST
jgi:hypothetical protein